MHGLCDAEFTGSHLCHVAEYDRANSATPVPGGGAWVDMSAYAEGSSIYRRTYFAGPRMGRYASSNTSENCSNWTAIDYDYLGTPRDTNGTVVNAGGAGIDLCNVSRALACCTSPYVERFAGYTATSYTGDVGGRAIANFHCASEFAGSHICHVAEYDRAHPNAAPPTDGAWVDMSAYAEGSSIYRRTYFAGARMGRYASSNTSENCSNWTAIDYDYLGTPRDTNGTAVKPEGAGIELCNVARPFACCW